VIAQLPPGGGALIIGDLVIGVLPSELSSCLSAACERARDVDGSGESCTWVGRLCERQDRPCGGSLRRRSRLARVFGTSRAGLSGAAADDLEAADARQSATRSSGWAGLEELALAWPWRAVGQRHQGGTLGTPADAL
jgi:hypothetical protein